MPALPLDHIGPFLLVLFRLSGLFIFAPMIGSSLIPFRIRTLIVFMFALCIYPSLPPAQQSPIDLDLFTLAPVAFGEVLIGLGIGLLASLPMYAVQLGGLIGGQQLGLGLAGIYNPAIETESDIIGQMLLYVALSIFAAAGGLELMFIALSQSFNHIPIGDLAAARSGATDLGNCLLGLTTSGFDLALRVSTPILCIVLLETLATAFLMKTIPQINIMSLGFASKVLLGIFVLILSMGTLGEIIGDDIRSTCDQIMIWAAGDFHPSTPR